MIPVFRAADCRPCIFASITHQVVGADALIVAAVLPGGSGGDIHCRPKPPSLREVASPQAKTEGVKQRADVGIRPYKYFPVQCRQTNIAFCNVREMSSIYVGEDIIRPRPGISAAFAYRANTVLPCIFASITHQVVGADALIVAAALPGGSGGDIHCRPKPTSI